MDGPWISTMLDTPINSVAETQVNLTTTLQAMVSTARLPNLGNNYFNYVGKRLHMKATGWTTSGGTPGNMTLAILAGNNANNTGTNVAGVTTTWTASQTNYTFNMDMWVQCRALGVSGSLLCEGIVHYQSSGIYPFNFTAPGITTVDLTQNPLYLSPQFSRSGSTAEVIRVLDIWFEALN